MGLDLAFYNVKKKINNLDEYYEKTRSEVFNELNKDYDKFYKFEESIKCNLGDDWNIVHVINKAITTKKVNGIDYSSEYDSKILTKKDLEDVVEFLDNEDNIATKVLGYTTWIDRDSRESVDIEEKYPKEYWQEIKVEFEKILEWFDFENNTLMMHYSY